MPVSAAGIISVVDDRTATAGGVRTVDLASDRTTAAQVRPGVIDLGTTASCVPAVRARPYNILTANGTSVVVRRGATAASVESVGLGSGHAAAADLGAVVVDGVTTTTGAVAVRFVSQRGASTATYVQARIIHPAVAAFPRRVPW